MFSSREPRLLGDEGFAPEIEVATQGCGCQHRFGIPFWGGCTTQFRTYFSGGWDVHWAMATRGMDKTLHRLGGLRDSPVIFTGFLGLSQVVQDFVHIAKVRHV